MGKTEYITLEDAAELMGNVSTRTVRRRIKRHGWETHLDKGSKGQQVRMVRKEDVLSHVTADLPAPVLRELSRASDTVSPAEPAGLPAETIGKLSDSLSRVAQELRENRRAEHRRWWATVAVGLVTFGGVAAFAVYALQVARAALP